MTLSTLIVLFAVSAQPDLAWKQQDGQLALARGEKVVWQLHCKKEDGKPYLHPVSIGETVVTDFRPADHFWHKALWFSWKTINGVLYWEEDPKTGKSPGETEVVGSKLEPRPDFSARCELQISYHPPGKPAVLTERRILEMTPPAADGSFTIDWVSTFTAGETEVLLDRTPIAGEPGGVAWGGYAGLSFRLNPALKTWQYIDSQGKVPERAKNAKWIAFSGPLAGKSGAIVVLDHPSNPRHPSPWYLIPEMPYFSPAVLYREPMKLAAGKSFTLKYRIRFQAAAVDPAAVDKQWEEFAK